MDKYDNDDVDVDALITGLLILGGVAIGSKIIYNIFGKKNEQQLVPQTPAIAPREVVTYESVCGDCGGFGCGTCLGV